METRIVWITLLAMADKDGIAEASVPGLADFARVPVDATRQALQALSSPDPDSRSHEFEGRRIEPIDGGWRLLNHAKYRAKLSADERREYNRIKQAEYRSRQKSSLTVNHNKQNVHIAEAEAEAEESKPKISRSANASLVDEIYEAYPRKVGSTAAKRAINKALLRLLKHKGGEFASLDDAGAFLLQRVRLFSQSPSGQAGNFTPHGATWFNQDRYSDDEGEWWKRDDAHQQRESADERRNRKNDEAFARVWGQKT